jgi:site-specific DNA-methyltransferase (adenine-specific)
MYHLLINGDCVTNMNELAEKTVDIVITSPPYNIGIGYGVYDDNKTRNDYLKWMKEVSLAIKRVLIDDGSLFLNIGDTCKDPWITQDVASIFREDFYLQNRICWVKSISVNNDTIGHFKPINSKRFLNNNHENIFHFTKSNKVYIDKLSIGVPFKDKSNINRRGHSQDKRCAGNVWYIPYQTVNNKDGKFNHPAGFPLELPKRCIKMHGKTDGVVLDPFVGSGTTLVAAKELGHSGIGMDIDETYIAIAKTRLDR